jgi:hypothetical protein
MDYGIIKNFDRHTKKLHFLVFSAFNMSEMVISDHDQKFTIFDTPTFRSWIDRAANFCYFMRSRLIFFLGWCEF